MVILHVPEIASLAVCVMFAPVLWMWAQMWEPGWDSPKGAQFPVVWPSRLCLPLRSSGLSTVVASVATKVLLMEHMVVGWGCLS